MRTFSWNTSRWCSWVDDSFVSPNEETTTIAIGTSPKLSSFWGRFPNNSFQHSRKITHTLNVRWIRGVCCGGSSAWGWFGVRWKAIGRTSLSSGWSRSRWSNWCCWRRWEPWTKNTRRTNHTSAVCRWRWSRLTRQGFTISRRILWA